MRLKLESYFDGAKSDVIDKIVIVLLSPHSHERKREIERKVFEIDIERPQMPFLFVQVGIISFSGKGNLSLIQFR